MMQPKVRCTDKLPDCGPLMWAGQSFQKGFPRFLPGRFANFGGRARVILNDSNRTIEFKWTKDPGIKEPKDRAMESLRSGKVAEVIPLMWTLHQKHPNDTDTLYNLGVAYSELGELQKAIAILRRLVEIKPVHVHGLNGLGVTYTRTQQLHLGEEHFRRALKREPSNPRALRNLGACLLQGKRRKRYRCWKTPFECRQPTCSR